MITAAGPILPLLPFVLYMQVRTRAMDDVLRAFVHAGGDQVVLLGAGFDCRAVRFAAELARATVYEVDHPATMARKREVLAGAPSAPVRYLAWDFEEHPLAALPAALAAAGHDVARRTLTIWEGVTMYLTEPAIDASVAAVAAYSAPGSQLAFTYFDEALARDATYTQRFIRGLVAGVGEPWKFGWKPAALPAWLAARGFTLEWDRDSATLAATLLPAHHARRLDAQAPLRHMALAGRSGGAAA